MKSKFITNLKKLKRTYPDIDKLIIFLILTFPWMVIHEYLHCSGIKIAGKDCSFNFLSLIPHVSFDTNGLTIANYLLIALMPYIVGLLILSIMLLGFSKKKQINDFFSIVSFVIFFDMIVNAICTLLAFTLNLTNDFKNLILLNSNFVIFPISVIILSLIIFSYIYKKNKLPKKIIIILVKLSKEGISGIIKLVKDKHELILTLFSIWLTFYFLSPINLTVWHNISDDGVLTVHAKNNDFFRPTDTINLYRLDISDSIPHVQLTGDNTLMPGEEKILFNFRINISEQYIELPSKGDGFIIPGDTYYLVGKNSISYKVSCDTCSNEIIKRIPTYQEYSVNLKIDRENRTVSGSIPVYSWIN